MLSNLQILRGLAALGVVFYHTDYRLAGDWHTDFNGVAIFFVISGFIMSYITQNGERDFLTRRVVRIVPMYWIATLALIIMGHRFGLLRPSIWINSGLWFDLPRSLLFLPAERFPVLGVGWTLNFEMYFYLVFAGALALNRKLAPILTAAAILGVFGLDWAIGGRIFLLHYYSHSYVHYFIHGIAVYYIWALLAPRTPYVAAMLCAAIVATWFGMQFGRPLLPDWILPQLWLGPTVVVAAALFMERSLSITWRPLTLLGDASYSLYLTHTIWLEWLRGFQERWHLPTWKESTAMMLATVIGAILIGIAVHLWVEKPLLTKLRAAIKRQRGIKQPPTVALPAMPVTTVDQIKQG